MPDVFEICVARTILAIDYSWTLYLVGD